MKWFHDLRLATKLAIAFASVLVLTLIVGVFSIVQLAKVNAGGTEIAHIWMPSVRYLLEVKAGIARHRSQSLQHLLSDDEVQKGGYEKSLADIESRVKKAAEDYEKLIVLPEERVIYDEFIKIWARYATENARIISLSRANKSEDARSAIRAESSRLNQELSERIDKLVQINIDGGIQASHAGEALYVAARTLIVTLLIAGIAIGIVAAALMTRWLMKQLGGEPAYAAAIAGKIAAGDLSVNVKTRQNDRTSLLFAMKSMRDSLANIVSEVRHGTETIAAASNQIASGNLDLSSRTEQQAGSLEETASSMEELTSTVKQNADNARQANSLASTASDVASRGGAVVSQVVETMGSINDSSKKIVDIIGVIDGIAFQTNILALNAAVEAARAGEQGRGFAVVASEVRSLAQRSAAAAKEIKVLIDASVEKVDTGSKLVDQAGATMQEIVESVKRVTDITGEITLASAEQTDGIGEVNQAIGQMDQVTQQNAALVEQAAAAAQDQTGKLTQVVSVFRLDGVQRPTLSAVAAVTGTVQRARPIAAPLRRKETPARLAAGHAMQPRKIIATTTSNDDWEEF
ncbi:MAG: methyl-accepting chemotaxis protein [Noviherbaspirillum sp.]